MITESQLIHTTHFERAEILLEELVKMSHRRDYSRTVKMYGCRIQLATSVRGYLREAVRALVDTGGFTAGFQETGDGSFSHWTWIRPEPHASVNPAPLLRLEGGPEDPLGGMVKP